jgi:hypothetical protein
MDTLVAAFAANLFAAAFASQRLLEAALFTRLHVEGVSFDILDDVLLLHFTLEAS